MPGAHARLNPSSADRWMACPGSVVLAEGQPEIGNHDFANEGTAAHFLASECLASGKHPAEYLGQEILVGEHDTVFNSGMPPEEHRAQAFPVDVEMTGHVNHYVQAVRRYANDAVTMLVEKAVPIGAFTGEEGATGTADVIIITADGELQVHDLKYGQGKKVSAEANRQLLMYALGADQDYSFAFDYDRVRLVIHQVRVSPTPSEWSCTLEDLQLFAEEVRLAAEKVVSAEAVGRNGGLTPFLAPSETACQWCRVKHECPALLATVREAVSQEFEGLGGVDMPSEPAGLGALMDTVGLVEQWCRAVRGAVEYKLFAGESVAGYKLVQGKRGNRKWADEAQAEAALKAMRLKTEEMYDFKLISPTTAEKLAKAKIIGPRQWPKVQALITQAEGQPSVAPSDDPRPAIAVYAKSVDFDGLEDLV